MRQQGYGRIIQNSSILGFVTLAYRGAYNTRKYAIGGLSDTLRLELMGTDIHVSLVELKPRVYYQYNWSQFANAKRDNSISKSEVYLNEGLIQLKLSPNLFTSYGRENLQWGSAFIRSPSNPFFVDNGRDNPKKEVEGKDFFKVVYLPNNKLSIATISNLVQGGLRIISIMPSNNNGCIDDFSTANQWPPIFTNSIF